MNISGLENWNKRTLLSCPGSQVGLIALRLGPEENNRVQDDPLMTEDAEAQLLTQHVPIDVQQEIHAIDGMCANCNLQSAKVDHDWIVSDLWPHSWKVAERLNDLIDAPIPRICAARRRGHGHFSEFEASGEASSVDF